MEKKQLTCIGSGGLPIWWWDLKIHLSDRLIHIMMIDRAMETITVIYFLDVGRGRVNTYSILQEILESNNEFAVLDFTQTPSQGRIQDDGFSPFREINLEFQERRIQIGLIAMIAMMRVVQHQHGGTFSILVQDPRITLFYNSNTIREENIGFEFLAFTFGRLRSGFLQECYFKDLMEFMQLIIVSLIMIIWVVSCIRNS